MLFQFSPDRNPDDKEAEIKFKEITEAYESLTNPTKNNKQTFSSPFTTIFDIFNQTKSSRGRDVFLDLMPILSILRAESPSAKCKLQRCRLVRDLALSYFSLVFLIKFEEL